MRFRNAEVRRLRKAFFDIYAGAGKEERKKGGKEERKKGIERLRSESPAG